MNTFYDELNELLVEAYRSIMKVEEDMLKSSSKIDLSISEIHLIEAVGKDKNSGKTISGIADDLDITLPSVTIAINKLAKKGYVEKIRSENDGRAVKVTLTKAGLKMYSAHRYFHESMARAVAKDLSDDEKEAMLKGMINLNKFFVKKIEKMED